MKNIWITFSTSIKARGIKGLMKLNQNCSLFLILMTKTNYDQLENFPKNWKENWKELGQPDSCFWSQVYEINYNTIQKQKKN